MGYRGIIFDFNGVLWWDEALQVTAWNRFATELRGAPFTEEEFAVEVHGRTNRHTLEHLAGRGLGADEVAHLTERKESIYRGLCLEQGAAFRLSPGAIALLDGLVARGVPRTIATASEKNNVDFFVRELELARWFDPALIVYDDGVRPGKPAPDIYRQAADNLGLPAPACVVVEDSRSGIQAAQAAGVGLILALGPAESHAQLSALPGVGRAIASLEELSPALFTP